MRTGTNICMMPLLLKYKWKVDRFKFILLVYWNKYVDWNHLKLKSIKLSSIHILFCEIVLYSWVYSAKILYD